MYNFPASHCFIIKENKIVSKSRFYNLQNIPNKNSLKQNIEELDYLINDSIKLRLRSDVKLGSMLSGGVDSSILTSIASTINPKIESFHFKSKKYDESKFARLISDKYNIKLNIIEEKIDLDEFNSLIKGFDYPFNSMSIYAQNQIFAGAKQNNFKVLLSGQGADELFLGYDRYKFLRKYYDPRHYIFFNKFINGLFNKFRFKMSNELYTFIKDRNNINFTTHKTIFDFQKNEIEKFQLPQLLFYEDQNSMLQSIESRVPFLDYRLVQFAINLPFNHKIRKGETKYILKEYLKIRGDQNILDRKEKYGFEFDFKIFFNKFSKEFHIKKIEANPIFHEFLKSFSLESIKKNDWLFWRFVCLNYIMESKNF